MHAFLFTYYPIWYWNRLLGILFLSLPYISICFTFFICRHCTCYIFSVYCAFASRSFISVFGCGIPAKLFGLSVWCLLLEECVSWSWVKQFHTATFTILSDMTFYTISVTQRLNFLTWGDTTNSYVSAYSYTIFGSYNRIRFQNQLDAVNWNVFHELPLSLPCCLLLVGNFWNYFILRKFFGFYALLSLHVLGLKVEVTPYHIHMRAPSGGGSIFPKPFSIWT